MRNVIVGGGVAALRAAESMREAGFDGEIVLIGEEPELPYDRPPLSKAFLNGERLREDLWIQPASFFEEQRISLRPGRRVTALRVDDRAVVLDDASAVRFDQLLVATGARPVRLEVEGEKLDGVHYLRTVNQAQRLASSLPSAHRVVVVGAGLIGLEVAAIARGMGKEVVVLEAAPTPLRRVLGRFWGQAVADLHRSNGVALQVNVRVKRFIGHQGRVCAVELGDGKRVEADLVLIAIGVRPNCEWLDGSGVRTEDGVLVDELGRTNLEGVFAAGDVSNQWVAAVGKRMRLEQYGSAQSQGAAVGKTMAGIPTRFSPLPGAGSEQFGIRLQAFGELRDDLRSVVRGQVEERRFIAFFVDESQRVRGAFAMGRPREGVAARKLVAEAAAIDVEAIANPQHELAMAVR